jgi:hypothetical protein
MLEGAFKGELVLNPKKCFLSAVRDWIQKGELALMETRWGPFSGVTAQAWIATGIASCNYLVQTEISCGLSLALSAHYSETTAYDP